MFQDRIEAGFLLAEKLIGYKDRKDAIVLAIPRGGVVVGKQIADILNLPLGLVVVKKIGAPGNPELAIGAVASQKVAVIDKNMASALGVTKKYLDEEVKKKREEIEEKEKKFKIQNSKFKIYSRKIAIIVDDGIATGATTRTAIEYIKEAQSSKVRSQKSGIILAVPVIAGDTYGKLKLEVDELVALEVPEYFSAVGQFYREFEQVTDEEVIKLLAVSR